MNVEGERERRRKRKKIGVWLYNDYAVVEGEGQGFEEEGGSGLLLLKTNYIIHF